MTTSEKCGEELKKIINEPKAPPQRGKAIKTEQMYHSAIPSILKGDHVLSHFTRADTAIQHILFNKQLRLSPRASMSDPMENLIHKLNTLEIMNADPSQEQSKNWDESHKRKEQFAKNLQNTKQLSFCMNATLETIDDLGFLNLRMWDQYGDAYKGVCLLFDKKTLIDTKNHKDDITTTKDDPYYYTSKKVDYTGLQDLNTSEKERSTHSSLLNSNPKVYDHALSNLMNKKLYSKHKSYIEENEFRLCAINENTTYQYINFEENSLLGILYFSTPSGLIDTPLMGKFNEDQLYNYAEKFKIGLYRIKIAQNYQEFTFDTMLEPMEQGN